MAGANTLARDNVPHLVSASTHPAAAPVIIAHITVAENVFISVLRSVYRGDIHMCWLVSVDIIHY